MEAKSLETGLKGLSDYHSSETAVEAVRWEPGGRVKGPLSQGMYSRGELDNSSRLNLIRATGSPLGKSSQLIRNSYSLFLGVMVKMGVADDDDDDDSQVHVTAICYTEDLVVKSQFK